MSNLYSPSEIQNALQTPIQQHSIIQHVSQAIDGTTYYHPTVSTSYLNPFDNDFDVSEYFEAGYLRASDLSRNMR